MASTTHRALRLLSLLGSRRQWPLRELATRLEVSERTVRRDIDTLRELGYPVTTVHGPHGGYRLGTGHTLPPLLFDHDQAFAVACTAAPHGSTGSTGRTCRTEPARDSWAGSRSRWPPVR